jgi:hypothetical protein
MALPAERAAALDHGNLDAGRPLRLEDPYPVAAGEWAVEAGVGVEEARRGRDAGLARAEVLYGIAPNLHVSLEGTVFAPVRAVRGAEDSGDVVVSGLYNLNQETLTLPAFGLEAAVALPTGPDASGTDLEVKGLVTRSWGRVGFHLNAGYALIGGARANERDRRYLLTAGASLPLGAPSHTRTLLVVDAFRDQAPSVRQAGVSGAEIGVRHQLTARTVLDAGTGTELRGPEDRSRLSLRAGISIGF